MNLTLIYAAKYEQLCKLGILVLVHWIVEAKVVVCYVGLLLTIHFALLTSFSMTLNMLIIMAQSISIPLDS